MNLNCNQIHMLKYFQRIYLHVLKKFINVNRSILTKDLLIWTMVKVWFFRRNEPWNMESMCVQTDFEQWHISNSINQPPAITIWVIQSVCGFRLQILCIFFTFSLYSFCMWSTFHNSTLTFFFPPLIPIACKLHFSSYFDVNRKFHSIFVGG